MGEGESAARSEIQHNAWFDAVEPLELSSDAQIGSFAEPNQSNAWAEYDLNVPVAGTYRFWLQASLCTGTDYRLDGGQSTKLEQLALGD